MVSSRYKPIVLFYFFVEVWLMYDNHHKQSNKQFLKIVYFKISGLCSGNLSAQHKFRSQWFSFWAHWEEKFKMFEKLKCTPSVNKPMWRKVLVLQGRELGGREILGLCMQGMELKFLFANFVKTLTWYMWHIASILSGWEGLCCNNNSILGKSCSPLGKGRENKDVGFLHKEVVLRARRSCVWCRFMKIKTHRRRLALLLCDHLPCIWHPQSLITPCQGWAPTTGHSGCTHRAQTHLISLRTCLPWSESEWQE